MGRDVHVVTGAFGFSGKYIARRLLDEGHEVRTLTNSPGRHNPFGGRVKAFTYDFDHPARLVSHLRGAAVLYNNYWVRFNYPGFSYAGAVENSFRLLEAALKAGVRRVVHVSILNPSEDSPFEYFSGKAKVERALMESGLSFAILRPAVLFGREDILINNIAWFLRNFPVFGVFGDGSYKLQPIYVDDLAAIAVEQGKKSENVIINAIGPETFTYLELVKKIGKAIGKQRPIVFIPPTLGYFFARIIGTILKDVTLTRDEIEGLMAGLLYVDAPPAGWTKLSAWLRQNASIVGIHYASELARRKNRVLSYEEIDRKA